MLPSSCAIALTLSFLLPLSSNHHLFCQITSKFTTLNMMRKNNIKGTKSSRVEPSRNFDIHNDPPGKPLSDTSCDNEVYMIVGSVRVPLPHNKTKNQSFPSSTKSSTHKNPELMSRSDQLPSPPTTIASEYRKVKRRTRVDLGAGGDNWGKSSFSSSFENNSSHSETSPATDFATHHGNSLRSNHFGKKKTASANIPHNSQSNLNYASAWHKLDSSFPKPYDICFRGKPNSPLIGSRSLEESNEICIETQVEGIEDRILMPGMVLLKHHLAHDEQVDIVKTCREIGLGPGGFYQPGFANGAKLRLKMMCLGLDWDPQTRLYGKERVIDGSKPPSIPNHFSKLVIRAIQEAHSLIKKECGVTCVEDILPSMSPDICIVNFYTTNGRLGLHQDRDESKESLQKGLPVVSFSIGDTAEFLYGTQRDVEKAKNVLLESGDVLIFGGESRHVFHGVSSIIPNSAPQELLQDTRLLPGRLNLTFRQY